MSSEGCDLDEAGTLTGEKSMIAYDCSSVAAPSTPCLEPGSHVSEISVLSSSTSVTVLCWFQCGYIGTPDKKNFCNVATKQYPRWVCHLCDSVRRCIERQMKNIPELQAWFKDLKVNHPDVWGQKIVSCRMDPNMPAGSSASQFYQSRGAQKVASFIQYATLCP